MAQYRVTRKRITQTDGQDYEAGDVWEDPPDVVLQAFGDRLERVDESDDEEDAGAEAAAEDDVDESPEEQAEEEPADEEDTAGSGDGFDVDAFAEQNAAEQTEAIESGEVDAHLDEIEEANESTNEYATVQQAIDERREA